MDRSRQMPNSTEQQSSSDDLIAELARLMAEEAQEERAGEKARETLATTPAPSLAPTPEPVLEKPVEPGQRLPEGGNVVRIPGERSASETGTPSDSVWGRALETSSTTNSDVINASQSDNPDDRLAQEPVPAWTPEPKPEPAADPIMSLAGKSPEQTQADDEAFLSALEAAAAPSQDVLTSDADTGATDIAESENPFDSGALDLDDPIANLIAEQAREEIEMARVTPVVPEPVEAKSEQSQTPSFASDSFSVTPHFTENAQEPVRSPQAAPPKTPESVPTSAKPKDAEIDSDVLSLLHAMNASRPSAAPAPKSRVSAPRVSEPLVSAPKTDASDDRFASSPGLNLASARAAKPASTDPLAEIENLIGDAVRLSDGKPTRTKSKPASVSDLDDAAFAAEAAIAAAAAETGRSERIKQKPAAPDFALDPESARSAPKAEKTEKSEPKKTNNKLVVAAAAAATLLVAVGLGLFWMFGANDTPSGTVPVLASNTADAKVPAEQNTTSAQPDQPAIFDELDGTSAASAADEQIVSRDQSETVASEVRQVASAETVDEGLANRKVRTVTVLPDGTIVSSDDTVAANEVLPVVRPDVPALSGESGDQGDFQVSSTPVVDAASAAANDVAAAANDVAAVANGASDPLTSIVESATATAETGASESVANAPFPAQRPADSVFTRVASVANTGVQATRSTVSTATSNVAAGTSGTGDTIDLIAGTANQVAAQLPTAAATTSAPQTTSQATSTATAVAAGSDAPAYVQLSSQRSEEAASRTLSIVSERYQGRFNGATPIIRRVDLGSDLGVFYRVLVPANSKADADGICDSVKAIGGDCFVRN